MDDTRVLGTDADPPLLTGGLTTPNVHLNALSGVSVDWLTLTIPAQYAPVMIDGTDAGEPGYAKHGFKQSEMRSTALGVVIRRHDPRQESADLGHDYESWEFSGPQAQIGVDLGIGIPSSRPSRVDIAFDFSCDLTTTADDVLEHCREHFEAERLTDGISGQGGINTRYIGSATSERRIRIYRKDLEDAAYAKLHGTTIRVEVILKAKHAKAYWRELVEHGQQRAYQVAAAHLHQMTGLHLEHAGDLPQLVPVEASQPAEKLAAWIQQNAASVVAFCGAGIDLKKLCDLQVTKQNRQAKYRRKSKEKRIRDAGTKHVQHLAKLIIQGNEKQA